MFCTKGMADWMPILLKTGAVTDNYFHRGLNCSPNRPGQTLDLTGFCGHAIILKSQKITDVITIHPGGGGEGCNTCTKIQNFITIHPPIVFSQDIKYKIAL